jgi:long-chain acyl-CoA synthetase
MALLHEVLEHTTRAYPQNPALIFHDRIVTYAELHSATLHVAAGLKASGIEPGDRVALLLPNCPAFVIAYYAATRIGAVVVPANPQLRPAELTYIWNDANVKLVVTVGPLLPVVQAARMSLPGLSHVVSVTHRHELPDAVDVAAIEGFRTLDELIHFGGETFGSTGFHDTPTPSDQECAVILYTSGTTGHPKGAMLSHRNLTRNVEQVKEVLHIRTTDRFLSVLPLFHAFAGTVCMNLPIGVGAASVILDSFAPGRTLEALERHHVTLLPAVPAIFAALLAHTPDREYDLSHLRLLISGGAPLPARALHALEARFGIPVLEGDGPTECSPVTSVNREEGPRKVGTVGPAIPGVEIAIFDEADRPIPTGQVGEIVVRGENVMLGYLNQPEETAEAMRGGWYHTGDLGTLDEEGFVSIVDRKKDMIITGGLNVYPREVEEILLSHPAVADVAVIGLQDAMRGEAVLAVVVRRPGAEVEARDLTRLCRDLLAAYKVPRKVLFRDTLPRGGTGKVVKRLLKKELELEATSLETLNES